MTEPTSDLETAIRAVYHGPLEDFISRRDALAKALRAAKQREDADRVKALRKPSRTAWALDSIAHEDPTPIERLAAVIGTAQNVSSSAELRTALENVRGAVRDVAAAGARMAIREGHPIDANALAAAVHAIIGDSSAFGELRAGKLVDVPDGGGLDILAAISIIPAPSPPVPPPAVEPPKPKPDAQPVAEDAERARAAEAEAQRAAARRAEIRRAETSLTEARERASRAKTSLRNAEAQLEDAEKTLARAEETARIRRNDLEHAKGEAEAADVHVRDAEGALAALNVERT